MGPCNSTKHDDSASRGTFKKTQYTMKRTSTLVKGEMFFGKVNRVDGIKGPGSDDLSKNVEAFITLSNITNLDGMYKIRISICNNKSSGLYNFLGETENEPGSEKIAYNVSFVFEYFFEREQILKFEIFESQNNKKFEEFIPVPKIMGSKNNSLTEHIENLGDLTVDCKNAAKSAIQFLFNISCKITKSDVDLELFYLISNINDGKNWRRVYKSLETCGDKNTIINFKSVSLMGDDVCGMDSQRKIKFEFHDVVEGQLGSTCLSLNEIKSQSEWPILDRSNSEIGKIYIDLQESKLLKFVDYLALGMQINLIVGVDFTVSNGNPDLPDSLHYFKSGIASPYERAIRSCGTIVGYYDYDNKFPVLGFGGRPPQETKANHCFNLNLRPDPHVDGIDAIIDTYKKALQIIKLDGPTFFAPLIRNCFNIISSEVRDFPNLHKYYILLIITDGMINDMDATCDILVECALYPMSVIIIGVGNADFTNMNILDGDDVPLTNSQGDKTKRDIVQFVEFKRFESDSTKLAEEVLQEVPRQVEEYYRLSNRNFSI